MPLHDINTLNYYSHLHSLAIKLLTVWNVNQPVGLPLSDAAHMQRNELGNQNELKQPLTFYTLGHAYMITA